MEDLREYSEEGGITLVRVLEDTSNETWARYKLEAIKTIQHSPLVTDMIAGEVFDVEKRKHSGAEYLLWQLSDPKT